MASLALLVAVFAGLAAARPSAVALTPSTQWYGIDGNWSTVAFDIGEPSQPVNVLVSTALSEFWVVQSGGCLDREPLCGNSRGNVFTPTNSASWKSIGTWSLGLAYLGYGGNGDYGLDTLAATTLVDQKFSMADVLTAALNATEYYIGFFGLGITQGNFAGVVHESPLTQAVQAYGRIPSYSYGYTAGAYYMGSTGVPCSLTLGGYDENRFIPHNTRFTLSNNGNTPQVLVRAISVSAPEDGRPPVGWTSTTRELSNMTTSFEAVIDSSTPYLWLPDVVCDQFAAALGLTYNSTFDLYTINNTQFDDLLGSSFSFTFSLSSFDNTDNFGTPLSVPGVVNITITAAAFAQVLRYPFRDGAIPYGAPSVPYFPLRRTSNSTASFIIGRAFLQEAYMIVRYDSGVFSLHESLYPEQPLTDLAIVDIDQPDNSPYPPPAGATDDGSQGRRNSLSTGQIVGIVVGVVVAAVLGVLAAWLCYRRRKRARKSTAGHDGKDGSSSSAHSAEASTPMAKLMSRMVGRSRSAPAQVHEAPGSVAQPTEVGAEAGHAVYELPAPMGPTELDASNDTSSITGDTELGTDNSHSMSAYEAARLKLAKQLQGPVPPYSPPENPEDHPVLSEKGSYEVSPATTHRPCDGHPSPLSSPTSGENSNSFPGTLPSPLSQRDGSMMRTPTLPSPITIHETSPGATRGNTDLLNTGSPLAASSPTSLQRSHSQPGSTKPVPLAFQRTPIDPSRVVCLGPMPEHMSMRSDRAGQQERVAAVAAAAAAAGQGEGAHASDNPSRSHTDSSPRLGQARESQGAPSRPAQAGSDGAQPATSPPRQGQTDAGLELIHVPQPADRRYSWEDDR